MNIEIPPAQDSPQHILNALNDDCIQSILRRLDNVRDFLRAAETCFRFQENAKLTFRAQYKNIRVYELYDNDNNSNVVTVDRLQSLLRIFGPLIVEIDFVEDIHDDILNMLAEYCGKTLKIFRIYSYNAVNFNNRSPFKALTELEIFHTNIRNFEYYSELRRLMVWGARMTDFDWLIQPFPQLENVTFYVVNQLRFDQAVEFLKLNPQLRSLYIRLCKQITPHIYDSIVDHVPNIEKLFLTLHESTPSLNERMLNVSKLRNLRTLFISSRDNIPVDRLIDSLIDNNVPVEVLGILNDNTDFTTSNLNISQMKQLKKLYMTQMSDETLVRYVKHLPQLEEMICIKQDRTVNSSPKITVAGIKRALQYGKHLTVLSVFTKDLTIDLDDFESVLSLAKRNHVKVTINIKNGKVNLSNEFLKANRKWLHIETSDEYIRSSVKIERWFQQA